MSEKVLCPYCNSAMKVRHGKRGDFYGCIKFPNCKGTRDYVVYPPPGDIKLVPGSPEQESIFDFLSNGTENGIIQARAGVGKAQPLTAKVLTPSGWKSMGDLAVGDAVVDPDGGIGYVEAIFPQGEKEVFNVTFSDGSSTQCCDEHLWLTQTVNERRNKEQTESVKSLKEIRDTLMVRNGNRKNHYIPMVSPVEFTKRELPIHPYLLGVLLGDGHFRGKEVLLATNDDFIVEKVKTILPEGCHLTLLSHGNYAVRGSEWHVNRILTAARQMGLSDVLAATKFVPSDYLYSSSEDRLNLLQGLLDADGYGKDHVVEYVTVSLHLASAVQELVWSFGGKVSITMKNEPKYVHKGEIRIGQPAYRLFISLPKDVRPFDLTRKVEAYTPRTKYQPYRSIAAITPVDGKDECQCIRVSTKRNLYVTDDYIVTHNTWTIVNSLMRLRGVKVGVFSFNNHIIKEMNEKLQKEGITWARGNTYNAFGYRSIRNHPQLQNAELFEDKLPTILNEILPDDTEEATIIRIAGAKLVRLCKCYMEDGTDQEVLSELVERFNIEVNGDCAGYEEVERRTNRIFEIVPKALELCAKRKSTLDFDDQVWWCVKMKLPVERFDLVLIDEAQDTNKMQQELVKMACP